jgi:YggT family protein
VIAQSLGIALTAITDLFILAALVRFWMQVVRAPSRNPMAQFSMALSDWGVKPLRRLVPGLFRLDLASLIVALVLEFALQFVLTLMFGASPIDNPGLLPWVLFLAFVELLRLSLYVFMGAIIIQAVLSWVAAHHPVMPFFDAFARPLLRPVRRVVPLVGGVDISPLFVLLFFQLVLVPILYWIEAESLRMLSRTFL